MTRTRLLAVVAAGLMGAGSVPGVASALELALLAQGGGANVTIAPGSAVTFDVYLINDIDLQIGTTSVALSQSGVVSILGASSTSPAAFPPTFSAGAPDGPTGKFGGGLFLPFLPPGIYDLGDITYLAVEPGFVVLTTIFEADDDWVAFSNIPLPPPSAGVATIEVKETITGGNFLDTPPLHVGAGSDPAVSRARCSIVNHGDKPIVVTESHIVDQNGDVAASAGNETVPAHRAAILLDAPVEQGFCRVRGKFSKRTVQVTFCSVAGGASNGACLEAVSAP